MGYVVGRKDQIVIAKEIREWLGVEPGWIALQRLVDDHVEVYFVPPEHERSLKGSLAQHVEAVPHPHRELEKTRELPWREATREKFDAGRSVS